MLKFLYKLKLLTSLVQLIMGLPVSSQIVLQRQDFPVALDFTRRIYCDSSALINEGAAGANITWDFGNLDTTSFVYPRNYFYQVPLDFCLSEDLEAFFSPPGGGE